MQPSRRNFLLGTTAACGLGAFAYGYAKTGEHLLEGLVGKGKISGVRGNAHDPEYTVDAETGAVSLNPDQRISYAMCMGCTTSCGVRIRTDKKTGDVLRVTGNPYHMLSTHPHLPYETPVKDSLLNLSLFEEKGLAGRSTACGRGNAVLSKLKDPRRVLTPMKRVGPRGGGQWKPIAFEQLIEEVVEGGDLFGEGNVEGLRAIRDVKTPIDPENPEFGPKSNQLVFMPPYKNGRLNFAARFAKKSFGTVNFVGHRSYCGLSMRAGYAALLDDWKKYPHLKPDFDNAKYMMFIGTAPGNAGNPFKLQGHLIAKARTERNVKYVVVDPVMTNAHSHASNMGEWVPIKPGSDAALVMAMIRWILENDRQDSVFLAQPSPKAAKAAGELSWSNATHLVIDDEDRKDVGHFVRYAQINPDAPEELKKSALAVDAVSGEIVAADASATPAQAFYEGTVTLADGTEVKVASSMTMLKREANKMTIGEYSAACGISQDKIVELAKEFTSHGKQAAADCHGGTMHSTGFYTAYAIVMLNALVGNLNVKGGTSAGGGKYKSIAPGPRYNVAGFPGKVKPKGVNLGRGGMAYEKTSEFARKKAAGQNPYPADAPWYTTAPPLSTHFLSAAMSGYPYKAKALITWSTNPIYGIAGIEEVVDKGMRDPKNIPLFVAIDPFVNETTRYADYIVPDTVLYESWGWAGAWGASLTKVTTARWPVMDSPIDKLPDGRTIDMETFLIEVAKRMGLPGFGDKAIVDKDKNLLPLNRPEDYYLRAAANVAFDGKPVADSDDEEMALTGVERMRPAMEEILKPEEWRKVAYVYNRGGRFGNVETSYKDGHLAKMYKKGMQIWNEQLGVSRNSMTGKRHTGSPTFMPQSLADGRPIEEVFPASAWPFLAVSTKSQLQSSHTIGNPSLQAIVRSNAITLNDKDAARLGIVTGDTVQVNSPDGEIVGKALVREGIGSGVVGIEHGFGHKALGATMFEVGGRVFAASALAGEGVSINDLGVRDPSSPHEQVLTDSVVGNTARQAIPVQVKKIA